MKSANGVLVLILGILSLVLCGCLTGIPAIIMGSNGLKAIASGEADPGEKTLVQIGWILGIIGTVLSVVGGAVMACTGGLAAIAGG